MDKIPEQWLKTMLRDKKTRQLCFINGIMAGKIFYIMYSDNTQLIFYSLEEFKENYEYYDGRELDD